ncbi:MAG: isocitrate lyase/PEP mutase family protein [Candidatus Rokubacteria bacterium]|nr:isocitrate lyase/PEP mutase family protein [Candidatus Rokubacteria bacterium]
MAHPGGGPRALRALLGAPGIIVAPGAYDAVSARLVERAGFSAVYIGSYATAASRVGLPDAGLVSMREMVDQAAAVVGAVERIPVIADGENGFGSAVTVWRTVGEFERAGVAGIHLEDHEFGKHLPVTGRVLPKAEMVEKVKAAVEARRNPDFVIIARTDAGWLGGGGLDEAVDRCLAYGAAGADMVFPAGVRTPALAEVAARVPHLLCAVDSPGSTVSRDEAAGVKLVLYYSLLLFAAHHAVQETLAAFRAHGDRGALAPRLTPEADFDEFIGFPRIQALAARHGLQ